MKNYTKGKKTAKRGHKVFKKGNTRRTKDSKEISENRHPKIKKWTGI